MDRPDKNKRVLLAMSGGVDSSTAAIILKSQGFEVIGVTMKLWQPDEGSTFGVKGCCSVESARDAKYICHKLGVPHYSIDYRTRFKKAVINNFIDEYFAGRTPNPCIRCNTFLKWGELIKLGEQLDAYYIATGHYAEICYDRQSDEYWLTKGIDISKDQSYALWGIHRDLLSRTLFPLGSMKKTQIRELLKENDVYFSEKEESQEICFIPDNDLSGFLKKAASYRGIEIKKNVIRDGDGNIIGEHNGFIHYTIGQRKGLGISHHVPLYVTAIDPVNNELVVTENGNLNSHSCNVKALNWLMRTPEIDSDIRFNVKIRYRHQAASARCHILDGNDVRVNFENPQRAVTPGQSAVFYKDNRVCGGGIIDAVE
ncbi:MAG: tRNA 2-thiouridine(34) synthase MnmA [candidate division Zixibacteria bacterium]|nr:tRNA 2-thiouridine(34) synthase MnmA [candidate division Zixibacteria bacterium]